MSDEGSRLKSILTNAVLMLVSILIAMLVVEFTLRSLGYSRLFDIYSKPSLFWEYDPLLGWRHAPNSLDIYSGPKPFPVEFSNEININSDGLRGEQIQPLSEDGLRVLLLGDSRVASLEVPSHETFSSLLAERLTQELGREVQVINAGVRGYGTDQSYLYYATKGYLFEPDLAVLIHSGNDLDDNLTLHRMKRPFGKSVIRFTQDGTLEMVNSPVPDYELCSAVRLTADYEVIRYDTFKQRLLCKLQLTLLDHSVLFSYLITSMNNNSVLIRWLDALAKPEKKAVQGSSKTVEFKYRHASRIIKVMHDTAIGNGSAFLFVIQDFAVNHVDPQLIEGVDVFLLGVGDEQVTWKNDGHYTPHGHQIVADRLLPPIRSALRAIATDR